jgi:exosortase E/protease (VPEID-CTERM system)
LKSFPDLEVRRETAEVRSYVPTLSFGLGARVLSIAMAWVIELIALTVWLDTRDLAQGRFLGLLGDWGPDILRACVTTAAICLAFGYSRFEKLPQLVDASISWKFLAGHLAAILAFGCLSYPLFHASQVGVFPSNLLAAGWLACGVAAIPLSIFVLIPPRFCRELARVSWSIFLLAIPTVVAAMYLGHLGQLLWRPSAGLTLRLVHVLLDTVVQGVVADPVKLVIGTSRFRIAISSSCSGLEGAGLMLVFTVAWILYCRREYRHPHVLVLIPASIALIWLLNSLRIAVLIMIGNAGAPAVALGGFHSQAGWIAFNASALGFVFAAGRIRWLKPVGCEAVPAPAFDYRAGAYLMPLLAILAAAMLCRSVSPGFEWLYPIRFLAAGAVLWSFRDYYRVLDWRISWFGPLIGIGVFCMWIGLDMLAGGAGASSIPAALSAMPAWARILWLAGRIGAAVITVPIAEELAFRGFLLRRLVQPEFDAVEPRAVTWLPMLISSLIFGALHGNRWVAGAAAGFLYAATYSRRGRIGDAVIAHAVTNALLAGWVVFSGSWGLW